MSDQERTRRLDDATTNDDLSETVNVPLAEEEVEAHVTERQMGRLRISKRVDEEEQVADIELHHDDVQVDRTTVNEFVTEPKGPWYDGDTLVIPVYEEQLVTEVRLVLKEEIRVRNAQQSERVKIRETARKEVLDFETIPENEDQSDR